MPQYCGAFAKGCKATESHCSGLRLLRTEEIPCHVRSKNAYITVLLLFLLLNQHFRPTMAVESGKPPESHFILCSRYELPESM